ncbi:MAG: A/G-specific adenine glycosylase, partial [Lachnospiraceae bacterium]|nr:A/G-specific adenine glycosylase [Lachnospiraceae bacterium]
ARHIFTHKEWHMTGYEILTDEVQEIPGKDLLTVSLSRIDQEFSIPSAFSAYMAFVREGG